MPPEPNKIIYSMLGVGKSYEKKIVLKDIWLSYFYGAKIGVLGLNGAGKSSLLHILAGLDQKYEGKIVLQPGYTTGFLPQEPLLDDAQTVLQIVRQGVHQKTALLDEFNAISDQLATELPEDKLNQLLEKQGQLQEQIDHQGLWDSDSQLEMAMDALRCPPGDTPIHVLSGGERRRVALCRLLLQKPDILILDEPTNHLDAQSVGWLEQHLLRYPGTVIAVTHDRYFLDNVAGWILELDRGQGIPWKGNYSSWLEQKQARLAIEEKQESMRQKALARELEWVRASPRARQAKSKARLAKYQAMLAQDQRLQEQQVEIYIPPGPRLGDRVLDAVNLTKSYGDHLLFQNLSFSLPPNAILGVIGANGAGKTTLFRLITAQEQPDAGQIRLGESVKLAYVEQSRDSLNPDHSIWQAISDGQDKIKLGNLEVNSRAYVSRFSFTGTDQQRQLSTLSGGERNRVHLARILKQGANLLLLDEPTNDLDVNTLRSLEDALENFAGSAIVISHDRWFLDRIATHILAFEGDSTVTFFQGDYTSYEEHRKTLAGQTADQPHRIKYRKLTKN